MVGSFIKRTSEEGWRETCQPYNQYSLANVEGKERLIFQDEGSNSMDIVQTAVRKWNEFDRAQIQQHKRNNIETRSEGTNQSLQVT